MRLEFFVHMLVYLQTSQSMDPSIHVIKMIVGFHIQNTKSTEWRAPVFNHVLDHQNIIFILKTIISV